MVLLAGLVLSAAGSSLAAYSLYRRQEVPGPLRMLAAYPGFPVFLFTFVAYLLLRRVIPVWSALLLSFGAPGAAMLTARLIANRRQRT